jgi:hypothetical protein
VSIRDRAAERVLLLVDWPPRVDSGQGLQQEPVYGSPVPSLDEDFLDFFPLGRGGVRVGQPSGSEMIFLLSGALVPQGLQDRKIHYFFLTDPLLAVLNTEKFSTLKKQKAQATPPPFRSYLYTLIFTTLGPIPTRLGSVAQG